MKSKHVVFGFFVASQLLMLAFAFASVALYRPHVALYAACVAAVLLCIVADVALFSAVAKAAERAEQTARAASLAKEQQAAAYYGQRLAEERATAHGVKAQVVNGLVQARDALAGEAAGAGASSSATAYSAVTAPTAPTAVAAPSATAAPAAAAGAAAAVAPAAAAAPTPERFCDHPLVDAVLSIEAQTCQQQRVRCLFDVAVPRDISVPETELCAVFSNMLDNAIAAQAALPEEKRFVGLKAQVRAGFLVVECTNAIAGDTQGSAAEESGISAVQRAATTKSALAANATVAKGVLAAKGAPRSITQEHGWGQDILATIATRHGGVFETRQEASTYICMVALGL